MIEILFMKKELNASDGVLIEQWSGSCIQAQHKFAVRINWLNGWKFFLYYVLKLTLCCTMAQFVT